jgi:hypothetical protein
MAGSQLSDHNKKKMGKEGKKKRGRNRGREGVKKQEERENKLVFSLETNCL